MAAPPPKRVAVIGSGVSGLAMIKACLDEGLEPVCFEKTDGIGGLWRGSRVEGTAAYDSLCIRTDVNQGSFMDFALPDKLRPQWKCLWVTGEAHVDVVGQYIEGFADEFALRKHIRFHTEVVAVEPPASPGGAWRVRSKDNGGVRDEEYAAVVVCTGRQTAVNWPKIPGQDKFKGVQLHSRDYKGCEYNQLEGKRVMVVGVGNSGCDIAVDLAVGDSSMTNMEQGNLKAQGHTASKVHLAMRSKSWVNDSGIGLRLRGLPFLTPVALFLLSHLYYLNLFWLWVGRGPHWALGFWFRRDTVHFYYMLLFEWILPTLFGVRLPVPDDSPVLRHGAGCPGLYAAVQREQLSITRMPVALTADGATFADGSTTPLDAIVYATGYVVEQPFLKLPSGPVFAPGKYENSLWKFIHEPQHAGLFFVGYHQCICSNWAICELQARVIAAATSGRVALPTEAAMRAEMAADQATLKGMMSQGSHGGGMQVHSPYDYVAYMLRLLGRRHPAHSALRISHYPGLLSGSGSLGCTLHTVFNLMVGSVLTLLLSAKIPLEVVCCGLVAARKAMRASAPPTAAAAKKAD